MMVPLKAKHRTWQLRQSRYKKRFTRKLLIYKGKIGLQIRLDPFDSGPRLQEIPIKSTVCRLGTTNYQAILSPGITLESVKTAQKSAKNRA